MHQARDPLRVTCLVGCQPVFSATSRWLAACFSFLASPRERSGSSGRRPVEGRQLGDALRSPSRDRLCFRFLAACLASLHNLTGKTTCRITRRKSGEPLLCGIMRRMVGGRDQEPRRRLRSLARKCQQAPHSREYGLPSPLQQLPSWACRDPGAARRVRTTCGSIDADQLADTGLRSRCVSSHSDTPGGKNVVEGGML
jgi:hypothetical protein